MEKHATKEEAQRYLDLIESFTLAELERWLEIRGWASENIRKGNFEYAMQDKSTESEHLMEVLSRLGAPDSLIYSHFQALVGTDNIERLIQSRRRDSRIGDIISGD